MKTEAEFWAWVRGVVIYVAAALGMAAGLALGGCATSAPARVPATIGESWWASGDAPLKQAVVLMGKPRALPGANFFHPGGVSDGEDVRYPDRPVSAEVMILPPGAPFAIYPPSRVRATAGHVRGDGRGP